MLFIRVCKIQFTGSFHKLASGEIRDVEVFSGPISFRDKELLHSIIFDATERKKKRVPHYVFSKTKRTNPADGSLQRLKQHEHDFLTY